MTTTWLPAAACALVLVSGSHLEQAQKRSERSPTHLVIDVVALGRDEAPINDLRRDEVEVWISGYRVPVDSFVSITPGEPRSERLIVLVLDDMTVPLATTPRVREAARRFALVHPARRRGISGSTGRLVPKHAG